MSYDLKLAYMTMAFACVLSTGGCAQERPTPPQVSDGVIDLSEWDFEKDGSVALVGDWHFWWEELLTPQELAAPNAPKPYGLYPVPSYWNTYPNHSPTADYLPGLGFATFQVRIKLPKNQEQQVGVQAPQANTSKQIFSSTKNQTAKVFQNLGRPGRTQAESIPDWNDPIGVLPLGQGSEVTLTMHVSNHTWQRGGLSTAPTVGNAHQLYHSRTGSSIAGVLIFGLLLMVSIYHFLLFGQRHEDRASFWLGVLCFTVGTRQVLTDKTLLDYLPISQTTFETMARLEYLTMPIAVMTMALFFHYLYPGKILSTAIRLLVVVAGCFSVLFLFGPIQSVSASLVYMQTFTLIGTSLVVLHLLKCAQGGNRQARLSLLSVSLVFIAIPWDIAVTHHQQIDYFIAPITFIACVLTQSYILAQRFTEAHTTAEHLSRHLQSEVDRQTAELRDVNESLRKSHAKEIESNKQALIQSEKLSQLGQLIASIGHEMATPIMLVTMTTENTEEAITKFEKSLMPIFSGSTEAEKAGSLFQDKLDQLKQLNQSTAIASQRLRDVSHALRSQSRHDTRPMPHDVEEIVKESLIIVGGRVKQIEIETDLKPTPSVLCYRSRIGQVITNILANAADALHEKRDATMSNERQTFQGAINLRCETAEREKKPGVLLKIDDNGDGVPDDIKQKIFDEFFTTKPAGQGTGLGLSMCAEIVHDHGGMLTIKDSEDLGGACFELWLPIEEPPA